MIDVNKNIIVSDFYQSFVLKFFAFYFLNINFKIILI